MCIVELLIHIIVCFSLITGCFSDDITQSDNDQAANHPIGDLTHCNHLIAGDSDIREQLRELQSSAQSDAATLVLSVPGSSRLDNGRQGQSYTQTLFFST